MEQQSTSGWYNYRTEQYEGHTSAPENLSDFIPQEPAAQNMYALLIEHMGYTPLQAVARVLSNVIGETQKDTGKEA